MATIIDFPAQLDVLDPQALEDVCAAYDQAVIVMNANHFSPPPELLAQRLLLFARSGVTDRDRLCRLASIGLVVQKG
jgi:hypothetical protein